MAVLRGQFKMTDFS